MATETTTLQPTESKPQGFTAEEFLKLDLGEGLHELVRGEIITVTPPGHHHGKICGNIALILGVFGKETGLGYIVTNDAALQTQHDPDTVRGPDIAFYSEARLPKASFHRGVPPVPPDVVVEVYSPSDRPGKMLQKVTEYLNIGVRLVIVVHPDRRAVALYRPDDPVPMVLGEQDVLENLPELPGFRCPIADFFT